MSIHQLEALWPAQSVNYKKWFRYQKRVLKQTIKRQYYVTDALTDSRVAMKKSEDLVIASLIIIAIIGFAAFSVLANISLTFALAASAISTAIHFNLAFLVMIGFGVMAAAYAWVATFLQGILAYAVYESAASHPKRSLRRTLQKSLHSTTLAATAWALLLCTTFVPPAAATFVVVIIAHILHIKLAAVLPYLLVVGLFGLAWAVYILIHYSLLPYVALFESKHGSWQAAAERAHSLARRKSRAFTASFYLSYLACAAVMYGLSLLLQAITSVDSIFFFVLFNMVILTAGNAALTMYFRKCRLARS